MKQQATIIADRERDQKGSVKLNLETKIAKGKVRIEKKLLLETKIHLSRKLQMKGCGDV